MTKTPPTMTIVEVPIDELRPDPANPRRISDDQLEALTRGIKEYGFVQPVLARREDNTVIGGHQRILAARRLGYKTVPVVFLDLSLEQARVLNLGLNKISGDWDKELLARLLADLQPVTDLDLSLSGFSEDELAKLLKSLDARDKKERISGSVLTKPLMNFTSYTERRAAITLSVDQSTPIALAREVILRELSHVEESYPHQSRMFFSNP